MIGQYQYRISCHEEAIDQGSQLTEHEMPLPAHPPLRQTPLDREACEFGPNPTKQRQGNQNVEQESQSHALGKNGTKD